MKLVYFDAVETFLTFTILFLGQSLNVVASDKGLVVGRIQFEEDGDMIDCTKMGVGGKAIPPYIDKIEHIGTQSSFLLHVFLICFLALINYYLF